MRLADLIIAIATFGQEEIRKLKRPLDNHSSVIMIGNGGSNSICSHIAQDYTKQLGKRAFAFSDPSRLTCYINDYGRDEAYAKFLSEFACSDTLAILISSSGNSENVYRCAEWCINNHTPFVMLTGFEEDNRMREDFKNKCALEVWVNSSDYGVVECAHQAFLHAVI